ncbi:tRNA uracil 4-sulfurtransferase ThiI [Paenibacillus allorhizosphaerae]|uniref:Probable tRNA sulfurtransferase n=1 Tax=Paenibacillus allorhizosphaerae TaxID=2849866 RepID=A0ABN7TGJ9_9BACL|nr:tRNA uracil 4-sulfurtransferase ThiI [Paenibacillus allorhizosphaerae]CAG7620310.1 putative tRNA sulfurtransferase [Paenibacillus allorhizosphaerae]
MIPDRIVLRLGELTLKGRNRHRFEKQVMEQVKRVLRPFPSIAYRKEFGRIVLLTGGADVEALKAPLRKVFGITSFSPVYTSALEPETIERMALQVMQTLPDVPNTFKVNVRRANKNFPIDSQEMNRRVGGHVLRAFPDLKVDVRQPEVELKVELREEEALIYCTREEGAGGFPVGSNGKAMLMLSGGIDSPVAGYLAMRQGLRLEAVHFHSYPFTSERSQQKVKDLADKLSAYTGSIKLHMVPFTDVQTKIHQVYNKNLLITLLRRAMMRIAGKLAVTAEAGAIVTGESLGQVASQTLGSMNAIGQVVQMPLIRPLVCMDKQSIIRIAESIDTYTLSILPYEDCCTLFLPPSPSTNPNVNVVESIERSMPWLESELDEAVRRTETVWIGNDRNKTSDPFASLF